MTNGPATPDTVLYSAAQRDNPQGYQLKKKKKKPINSVPFKKKPFFLHNDRIVQFADLPNIGAFIPNMIITKLTPKNKK